MISKTPWYACARKARRVLVSAILLSSPLFGQQTASPPAPASAQEVEELRELVHELQLKVAKLEGQQQNPAQASQPPADPLPANASSTSVTSTPVNANAVLETSSPAAAPAAGTPTGRPQPSEPFAFADWTWLNGNARTRESPLDTKFFTPEIRVDANYTYDFRQPKDDTIGGSSEIFRAQEVQVTQFGVGGDFHYDNVRARLMTQFGLYSQTTPRNDASPARGQWNLDGAYRYVSEAYGGYHFNALHGVNLDAGIFMSYIGLFSYYNFDNWAYQPSYVSSNTPWFFNGVRVQIFPSDKLKIEPWFINGWQSYGRFNSRPGIGGQVNWRPNGSINIISNNYGVGADALGIPNRTRLHTDDSIEVKYYDNPQNYFGKAAFSVTLDAGCETGGGVNCTGDTKTAKKQSFLGFMFYNRVWFNKDRYAVTLGGGAINNPGRYLVLLPPINGATAASGTTYFTENPGDRFKAWDVSGTFDYMPSQYITFRWEANHRAADVPYFSGPGGITPPGGNTGPLGSQVPGWSPDLRKDENRLTFAVLVKF